jgi:putative intracellular protease/amidase
LRNISKLRAFAQAQTFILSVCGGFCLLSKSRAGAGRSSAFIAPSAAELEKLKKRPFGKRNQFVVAVVFVAEKQKNIISNKSASVNKEIKRSSVVIPLYWRCAR